MTSRHLLAPEVAPIFEAMPPVDLTTEGLPAFRAEADAGMAQLLGLDHLDLSGQTLSERFIPGAPGDPDVRVLVLEPQGGTAPRPAILETHLGGHVAGKPEQSLGIYGPLARELGAVLVMVDYRLSPGTRFPGGLEDAYAALKWLIGQAQALNIDPQRIGLLGTSAGGGLAAGLALWARDRDAIPLAHLHLIQPMLDDRTGTDPDNWPYNGEYGWSRQNNAFGWQARLGTVPGGEDVSPYAAPARMADLSGLPSTFISCGSIDLFTGESIAFAQRLMQAGVATELHISPGLPHGGQIGTKGPLIDTINDTDIAAWKRAFGVAAA
ncbi:MAG: alpha/beta hydrolase fold domain-containing protein [Paracoccus sp. (in: a-proteobacteria)]|uniref:alpha/beta hydrolase fold domain-containing protein n=1 Tax=Paracoccus sp. TaxID=267 RepID=UPI0026DF8D14|nr:alpha/beta hydrolase fold domain-containing protein [Paracoccus sp. (in: a-proteobacteria)]MDO5622355.1 alpha/beta hydrolase fold domain-containing protein [Paracoccus sp. (in: a-proteobacteria)]